MFDPFSIFYFFTFLLFQKIAFKALFKPADAFLTVQRYSFFHKEPNLLNYFKRNCPLFLSLFWHGICKILSIFAK